MVGAALLAGGAFGVKHALEADHVAAVATLVEDGDRPASTGIAWGLGHSVPVLALGALFLSFDLDVPPAVATGFEALVGLVLVALGLRVLAGREAIGTSILRHGHGEGGGDDGPADGHLHLRVGGTDVGLVHTHADEESLAVGVGHGLAGSGGLVVALAAAARSDAVGAAFLLGFATATVAAMGVAAWGLGRAVDRVDVLRPVAGLASVAVGALLFARTVGIAGPF